MNVRFMLADAEELEDRRLFPALCAFLLQLFFSAKEAHSCQTTCCDSPVDTISS